MPAFPCLNGRRGCKILIRMVNNRSRKFCWKITREKDSKPQVNFGNMNTCRYGTSLSWIVIQILQSITSPRSSGGNVVDFGWVSTRVQTTWLIILNYVFQGIPQFYQANAKIPTYPLRTLAEDFKWPLILEHNSIVQSVRNPTGIT